jgi:hypothetical protein
MGDVGDDFRAWRDEKRRRRDRLAINCDGCPPNRSPSRLMPGQRCGWCGFRDPRDPDKKENR